MEQNHMNHPPQYFSAFVSDLAGAFQVSGGSVAGQLIQDLFKKRLDVAREILIQEIRAGEKDIREACDVDEVVAIVYRYMRAAQEGAAKTNLRLLAQIIAGQKASKALKANEFLYYADIVASLRHEEIILLGTLHRFLQEDLAGGEQKAPEHKAQERAKKELVSSRIFATEEDFQAALGALPRTGLVIVLNTWGGPTYKPSPLMNKLCKLASFEEVSQDNAAKGV